MRIACVLLPDSDLHSACEERRELPDDLWEGALRRLEGIGAAVESGRAGEAFFAIPGLEGIHGGAAGVLAAARAASREVPAQEGTLPVRVAAGPTRFAAFAAAARGMREGVRAEELDRFLAALPVATLTRRLDCPVGVAEELTLSLERLGIRRLGELASLSAGQVADRFGPLGLRALRLARGEDTPLCPRRPREELIERIDLPEGADGLQLQRALGLLVDRLLAAPQRRERTVRALRLGALLCAGGSWETAATLREPSASAETLRLVLAPKLEGLPSPAASLSLRATSLGPRAGRQLELSRSGKERRRSRLSEAVRQARAVAGGDAVLKVLEVDPASRVPERWTMLTPPEG